MLTREEIEKTEQDCLAIFLATSLDKKIFDNIQQLCLMSLDSIELENKLNYIEANERGTN